MNILEEIQNCPVEWKELGEVVRYTRGKGLSKKDKETGNFPIILYGELYTVYGNYIKRIVSFSSEDVKDKSVRLRIGDIVLPISSTTKEAQIGKGSVLCVDEVFLGGDAISLSPLDFVSSSYLMYVINGGDFEKEKMNCVRGTTIQHLNPDRLLKIKIPIPPLEIQEKIVQILDKMTKYVTELTSELTSRKKQYSYYRDKLLSFEGEVYQVEWKMLSECLKKGKGTKITASQMKLLHQEGAPIRIFAGGKTYADVNYGDIPDKDIHTEEAIVVKSRGIIDFEYCTKPFSFKNEFWSYSSDDENINLRYIYHYLIHNKERFQTIANNMQMPQISSNDTEKFKIPVPSLEIQSRIVQVLDNFDKVCNDLNIGLPKEIELRQKQYEYWREQLLNFNK